MRKTAIHACLLLLALSGKQLYNTVTGLAHAVRGLGKQREKHNSPITCVPQPLTLTTPPSAPFAGYSVVQAQNAQGENRYTYVCGTIDYRSFARLSMAVPVVLLVRTASPRAYALRRSIL